MKMSDQRNNFLGCGWSFPFTIQAARGRIAVVAHEVDIKQSIRILLSTAKGERVMRPDFGCGIRQMVFMPINDATSGLTRIMVHQALERWLGFLIEVNSVVVETEESTLLIDINYTVRSLGEQDYLNVEVLF